LLLLVAVVLILWLKPPALLRVGANYSAKIVCSNVFLAARNPDQVLSLDVQAPGIALLRFMQVSVDRDIGVVHAGFLGFTATAWRSGGPARVHRDAGRHARSQSRPRPSPRPAGTVAGIRAGHRNRDLYPPCRGRTNRVHTDAALDRVLQKTHSPGPGARAIVVVDHGLVGTLHARLWPRHSLARLVDDKTVMAGVIGCWSRTSKLRLDQSGFWSANDGRERIRLADLLAIVSGLQWNEPMGRFRFQSMLYRSRTWRHSAQAHPWRTRSAKLELFQPAPPSFYRHRPAGRGEDIFRIQQQRGCSALGDHQRHHRAG